MINETELRRITVSGPDFTEKEFRAALALAGFRLVYLERGVVAVWDGELCVCKFHMKTCVDNKEFGALWTYLTVSR